MDEQNVSDLPVDQPDIKDNSHSDLDKSLDELLGSYPVKLLQSLGKEDVSINISVVLGNVTSSIIGEGIVNNDKVQVGDSVNYYTENEYTKGNKYEDTSLISTDFEAWFFQQDSFECQIHAMLAAILSGNAYRFLLLSRQHIIKNISSSTLSLQAIEKPTVYLTPIQRIENTLLQKTKTKIISTKYTVESGLTEIESITFEDISIQQQALHFLSTSIDIDPVRLVLIEWLTHLCTASADTIRAYGTPLVDLTRSQAAIGLGELIKNNYGYYLSTLIRPWAVSQDYSPRFLVGWILFSIANDTNHRNVIFSLLTHWAKSDNSYMQWTAAAACSRVGLISIEQTLDIIKILLPSPFSSIQHAVRVSLALLYLSASNAYKIIEVFASWLKDKNCTNSFIYQVPILFLSLTKNTFHDDIGRDKSNETGKSNKMRRISFWHLIHREVNRGNTSLLDCITVLIEQSFNHPSAKVCDWTAEIIESWIISSNKEKGLAIPNSLYHIIESLLNSKISSKYISRILTKNNLANIPVVKRIHKT